MQDHETAIESTNQKILSVNVGKPIRNILSSKKWKFINRLYKKRNFNYSRENISIKKIFQLKKETKYSNQKKKIFIL